MVEAVSILGGGPAGAAAALALTRGGARAVVYEKSAFPRHKVCGEFLSPEILPVLEGLAVADSFLSRGPARVTHAELHFSRRCRRFRLPEPAFGLSRYAFDDLLLQAALERGAELRRQRAPRIASGISAVGRSIVEKRGRRVFGFKAHFAGPANDAVELYFFPGGYCGLCPVEGGVTNVCGLCAESRLSARGFSVDSLLATAPRLAERLSALSRLTRWHITGPLLFGRPPAGDSDLIPAGDVACFADPFTGTGLLAAVQTGVWAAEAILSRSREEHERHCASFYRRQITTGTIIRRLLSLGWAESLAGLVPGSLLFRLTRPHSAWSAKR